MYSLSAGNVFVIAAIIIERNLQNVANYLVASLAVADLMVACLVMPLGAVYEVRKTLLNSILKEEFLDYFFLRCRLRSCLDTDGQPKL